MNRDDLLATAVRVAVWDEHGGLSMIIMSARFSSPTFLLRSDPTPMEYDHHLTPARSG